MRDRTDAGHPLPIVCPACRGTLTGDDDGLCCTACGATFPTRAEVPVLLPEDEWHEVLAHLEEEREARELYASARRHAPMTIMYTDWWVRRLFQWVPRHIDGPLVELMCGGAEVCRRLPPRFSHAVGLDIDVEMVAQAHHELHVGGDTRVRLVCANAARVPLPDACTSVVLVHGALHHARRELPEILSEIHRILRPGGVLVASEPANDHPLTRAVRTWQYARSPFQGNDPDEDGFDRPELTSLLAAAGLHLDDYRQFGFLAYPLMGNTDLVPLLRPVRSRLLGRLLLTVDRALEHTPPLSRMAWASLFRAVKGRD
ncbi:MAG: methyltransferase domain-containing protein [Alphaproteobacteria bacterium]|nr:methyltransferase domain-containing protein [Alphaproteobacteria bacterium]